MDLTLNMSLGDRYKSATQKARVITEGWLEKNMYCPICGEPILNHYTANKPVADFFCEKCKEDFELKSRNSLIDTGQKITDGAYATMIERISDLNNPNLFVMTYHQEMVTNLLLIPRHLFTYDIIEKRNPLGPKARRAGWVGCNILYGDVPESAKIRIVKDSMVQDKSLVIEKYQRLSALNIGKIEGRSWMLDVMNCIEKIEDDEFDLKQVYSFENLLRERHPNNNFVKDKIRQQLQYLRDKGFIEFTTRGHYRKIF